MYAASISSGRPSVRRSLVSIAVATALLSAATASQAAVVSVRGVVSGSLFTAPVVSDDPAISAPSSTVAGVYAGAKVCFDLNNNGACDAGEPNTVSASNGSFVLVSATAGNVIAEIPATASNNGKLVGQRLVLRASAAQVAEAHTSPLAPANIAITPLTTEVVRMVENESLTFDLAKEKLAERLAVDPTLVLNNPAAVTDLVQQKSLLTESVVLSSRFTLAAKMLDRGDVTSMPQAQQAAMNVEGVPRYDHIFIVMLENKATSSIVNSPYAPNINAYLQAGNQFTNYYATGNPSEPNYTALGGADDFGITDDDQWNCNSVGASAPLDLPLPTNTQPGLGASPFTATCTDPAVTPPALPTGVVHNIKGRPNLFNAVSSAGLKWRTYNESTNPGQDFRTDSVTDAAVKGPDHVYAPGTLNGNTTQIGSATLNVVQGAGLYKTKHNPAMAYQNVRSAPEFVSSNRTVGGSQWDANLGHASVYAIPAGYDKDQLGTDLQTGDIGALNYVMPDQCDDMHSVAISGTDTATGTTVTASDCSGVSNGNDPAPNDSHNNIMARGDRYVKYLVDKIEGSPIWANDSKRVAIVLMFDEGSATAGTNSCCGWNPGNSTVAKPLVQNPDGSFSVDSSVVKYSNGNRGHGNSIFAVLTNQAAAPKGIKDSDAYSHFSFVRTLQDMFGLADPKVPGSYMNRSKYTESFIAANILNLPEYASSADTHFDSVRPMSHAYVIPAGYVEVQSTDESKITAGSGNAAGTVPAQVGPDSSQTNVWALK